MPGVSVEKEDTADLNTLFVLFNEIGIINQLAGNRFTRVLPDNLSQAQFSVLNNFVRLGGSRTPSQLAAAFQVTRGAMTNTLNRLQDKGAIQITNDPVDGRGKIVRITAKGRRLREKAVSSALPELTEVAAVLDKEELALLLPLLQRLRQWLDDNRPV